MRFVVKAVRGSDPVVDLRIDAADPFSARDAALRDGFDVLSVRARSLGNQLAIRRQAPFPTYLFAVELLALLRAGLNVVEAVSALSRKDNPSVYRLALEQIFTALKQGRPLSQALTELENPLPPVFVATVRSSEQTSDLVRSLARYVEYERQFAEVRKKIGSAAIYPAVLIGVASLVVLFLVLYVMPRFAQAYAEISTELPFFSKLLFATGAGIDAHPLLVSVTGVSLLAGLAVALSRRQTRAALIGRLLRVAKLEGRVRLFHLARLYRTLGMLLCSGVPVVSALAIAKTVLPELLSERADRARQLLSEGVSISSAMRDASLTTPIADQMLAVAERTGDMGPMMDQIAGFFDEELGRWLDVSMRLLEPVLMAVIGVAIGTVVVFMYMPIFELASSVR